jgi:hypothetical protein
MDRNQLWLVGYANLHNLPLKLRLIVKLEVVDIKKSRNSFSVLVLSSIKFPIFIHVDETVRQYNQK